MAGAFILHQISQRSCKRLAHWSCHRDPALLIVEGARFLYQTFSRSCSRLAHRSCTKSFNELCKTSMSCAPEPLLIVPVSGLFLALYEAKGLVFRCLLRKLHNICCPECRHRTYSCHLRAHGSERISDFLTCRWKPSVLIMPCYRVCNTHGGILFSPSRQYRFRKENMHSCLQCFEPVCF